MKSNFFLNFSLVKKGDQKYLANIFLSPSDDADRMANEASYDFVEKQYSNLQSLKDHFQVNKTDIIKHGISGDNQKISNCKIRFG